ncbi:MAG: 50S ribosomal protein L5 [Candidatus Lokiarchaeota archaeon]|nr:50S ribosomal protein L5 [Candidatus Lokiarchaeota archaeon]
MSAMSKNKSNVVEATQFEELWKNPMKKPFLEKIVLNIGMGSGGEELEKASTVLETISGMKAVKTISKKNVKEFNLRKGRPIGTKVTIRGDEAGKLLKRLLIVNNNKILRKSFDNFGNFGFGITEHITIPGVDYDNLIGIFGLDVVGRIVRPGMRVKYRRKQRAKVPRHHYVSKAEVQYFLKSNFGVEIVNKLELEYF